MELEFIDSMVTLWLVTPVLTLLMRYTLVMWTLLQTRPLIAKLVRSLLTLVEVVRAPPLVISSRAAGKRPLPKTPFMRRIRLSFM